MTYNAMKRKYHMINGVNFVRKVVSSCIDCKKAHKKPVEQKMGPLPDERVKLDAVFERTGLDLMGPFLVKRGGRSDHKIWVCIFVCLASRAVRGVYA